MKTNLTPPMQKALEILKNKGQLTWETGVPACVSRKTLDALEKRGLARVETSGARVSHYYAGRFGFPSYSESRYSSTRRYFPIEKD